MISRIFILSLLVVVAPAAQADERLPSGQPFQLLNPQDNQAIIGILQPMCTLSLNADGKTASINFCGTKVTFTGDLPVDDAAKMFFESVGALRQPGCGKP
jgi:hypothetical protein